MLNPHRFTQTVAIVAISTLSNSALAWNAQGHQDVGAVADRLIAGSHAEAWVRTLLDNKNLQTVSVWADCAKGVKSVDDINFVYQDNPQYFECAPFSNPDDKQRFESYVKRNWKQCGTVHGNEFCHNQYHYTDVSNLRKHYETGYAGTSTHDVVHSINAAIAVLRDRTPDAPFSIADKREALMLLTHYVGDIHQPLHVTALYLNAKGEVVDPDKMGYKLGNDTAGGNNIIDGKKLFHGEWDTPPADLIVNGTPDAKLLQMARAVPRTSGAVDGWSGVWASDSIKLAPQVFGGLHFTMKPGTGDDPDKSPEKWDVTGIDSDYQTRTDKLKLQQIAKAGARLAQLLKAIWPEDRDLPHVGK
jgi:hypothetical protein